MSRVIVLWSGGKDAMQALCHARAGHQVVATFAPPEPRFLAHPLSQVRRQAAALGLPHLLITIEAPFDLGYETALAALKEEWRLDGVVTGDIDSVGARQTGSASAAAHSIWPFTPRSGSNPARRCWQTC